MRLISMFDIIVANSLDEPNRPSLRGNALALTKQSKHCGLWIASSGLKSFLAMTTSRHFATMMMFDVESIYAMFKVWDWYAPQYKH